MSSSGANFRMPGVVDQHVDPAEQSSIASADRRRRGVGVGAGRPRRPARAERRRPSSQTLVVGRSSRTTLGALGDERRGDLGADATGRAGDQRPPAGEPAVLIGPPLRRQCRAATSTAQSRSCERSCFQASARGGSPLDRPDRTRSPHARAGADRDRSIVASVAGPIAVGAASAVTVCQRVVGSRWPP